MSLPESNITVSTSGSKIIVAHEEVKEQLYHYRREQCTLNGDPLTWWREHTLRYPRLVTIAKSRLTVRRASVSSERAFSVAGNILTANRACLSSENVDKIIFLTKNMKLFPYTFFFISSSLFCLFVFCTSFNQIALIFISSQTTYLLFIGLYFRVFEFGKLIKTMSI